MVSQLKVAIAGINGRMGRASAAALLADPELSITGALGKKGADYIGKDIGDIINTKSVGVLVSDDISQCLSQVKADVLLDFSVAESAVEHALTALSLGVRPVIGASGISASQVESVRAAAAKNETGALIVPNFSIGAILMMEFAKQAGKHFSNVEIVEMHHTKKLDAPSGTAAHTAGKIAANEKTFNKSEVDETELLKGARGATHQSGVRIHSLRLPGLISHQDVIFGSDGELLTIRHDSFNTNCFVKGIILAIKSVMDRQSLLVGLETLL